MRITRLELQNFRSFDRLLLEDIPDLILLVSPNGLGKSSVLEAIAGAKDLVAPYLHDSYPFAENWNGKQRDLWPPHLRQPLRLGSDEARISIEVQPNTQEEAYIRTLDPEVELPGKAEFIIRPPRYIADKQMNQAIKLLFQYHSPGTGIGYLDYIPAIRFYPDQNVGDLNSASSDMITKQIISSFHRGLGGQGKFGTFKTYIASVMLNDASAPFRNGGERVDSLSVFREVFNNFFWPKSFGPEADPLGGPMKMLVRTPFGDHDTDLLSDGEKEVLNIMAYLYRFRDLSSVVLWDSPESHLNAALESRLHESLRRVAPNNQYWIATHSLELIGSVPVENLFVMRHGKRGAFIDRPDSVSKRTRAVIYSELGAKVGLQMVSSVAVFLEGKDTQSDKRMLDRLLGHEVPSVTFVAGGDCDSILAVGSRANRLLQEASANGDFLAVIDRDYRSDEEVRAVQEGYGGKVFVWDRHEIENVFMDPQIVFETLVFNDQMKELHDEDAAHKALRQAATDLREWIAADWVRWDVHQQFRRPTGRISSENPLKSLREYGERTRAEGERIASLSGIEELFQTKLALIDRYLGVATSGSPGCQGSKSLAGF
jgi:predicted ATPase